MSARPLIRGRTRSPDYALSRPSFQLPPVDWRFALWLALVMRVGLGVAAALSIRLTGVVVLTGEHLELLLHREDAVGRILSPWQRWDALWYEYIARHGYHAGDFSVHFQPLYPLVARLLVLPFDGGYVAAELLVSTVCFGLAIWLLYRLCLLDIEPQAATLTVLLTALSPAGFFFLAPYTESMFLLFTLAAFWFARKDRPWLAGIAGLCAAMTRFSGIFLVLPLAFIYFRKRDLRSPSTLIGAFSAALPGAGLIVQMLFERIVVGEHRSTLQIWKHWNDRLLPPWDAVSASVQYIHGTGDPIEVLNFSVLILFSILGILALRRLPIAYALYVLPTLALLFCKQAGQAPFAGYARYSLVLFPCVMVAAIWLERRPWMAGSVLLCSLALQMLFFQSWLHFQAIT